MSKDFFICPNCGEEVSEGKLACPYCGSDADTGWSDDTIYDSIGLPEEDIYEHAPKRGESPLYIKLVAWVVLGVFLYFFVVR